MGERKREKSIREKKGRGCRTVQGRAVDKAPGATSPTLGWEEGHLVALDFVVLETSACI